MISRETPEPSIWTLAWRSWWVICLVALMLAALRCTPAQRAGLKCKAEAAELLPDDPGEVTVSHVVEVVEAVRRCQRSADAGD